MSAFYSEVLRLLNSPPLNQHFDKSWTAHVQVKETLYDVESQLQQAAQLHKDDDIAPEIARLKVIISAVAQGKGMPCKLRAICFCRDEACRMSHRRLATCVPFALYR